MSETIQVIGGIIINTQIAFLPNGKYTLERSLMVLTKFSCQQFENLHDFFKRELGIEKSDEDNTNSQTDLLEAELRNQLTKDIQILSQVVAMALERLPDS